ncbi:uncharacterized protein ACNS7B_013620 [Menidia menidia]
MLNFMVFSHVWLLIHCIENSTGFLGQSLTFRDGRSPPDVIRFSVPEDHHVCMPCGTISSDVIWTFEDKNVLVTRRGSYQTNRDHQRYHLLTDGSFCLLQLDHSDGGNYSCNQRPVAELQVLTGQDFRVSAGRTLLLPCRSSSKPKQRWFRQKAGERRQAIFTRFRNGTEKSEIEGSRLSYNNDALQIQDLQPEDTGEYLCNGELQARVTIFTVQPRPTSILSATSTTPPSSATTTDVDEVRNKTKRRLGSVLLVAVTGLGLMIIFLAAGCIMLISIKCRRKKKNKYRDTQQHDDTELQLWKTHSPQTEYEVLETSSLPEETIHYAVLGRPNWRDRTNWSPSDQSHHVIYSSVMTRPATQNTVY